MPRLLFAFALLFLVACNDFKSEKPAVIYPETALQPQPSYLSTPLVLSLRELEAKINQAIQGEIYRDDSYTGDNLKLVVTKVSPLRLEMQGNLIRHSVVLNVRAKYKSKLIGEKDTEMTARLHFKSRVAVSEQWRLITKTKSDRVEWIQKPRVKLAFMKISLAGLVEKILKDRQPELERLIDQTIYEQVRLKDMVAKLWEDIQKPILINRKFEKLWIELDPFQLELGTISGANGRLTLPLRARLFLRTLVGDKPQHTINRQIPDLILNPNTSNDFDLNLFSNITYDDLNRVLSKQLKGKKLSAEGYGVTVRKAQVWPSGEELVVEVKVKGDVRGVLYFRGVPKYKPEDTTLVINNFNYDVDSEEMLLQTTNWLLHDHIREEIQATLSLSLHPYLKEIPALIQQGVSKSKVGEKLKLHLDAFTTVPREVALSKDGVQILVNAKGRVRMEIQDL